MSLSVINYSITGTTPDYLIRSVQAAEAPILEQLAAEQSASVAALNGQIQSAAEQWTPADANLAGAGDGHTFIYTVTYVRRRLNYVVPDLLAFTAGLLTPVSVIGAPNPPGTPVSVLPYAGGGAPIAPPIVPGPEAFVTKFALASTQETIGLAFADAVARALSDAGVPTPQANAPALWQQIVGAAKGTRFMGGVSVLKLTPP